MLTIVAMACLLFSFSSLTPQKCEGPFEKTSRLKLAHVGSWWRPFWATDFALKSDAPYTFFNAVDQ